MSHNADRSSGTRVLREDSVLIDFIGFSRSWAPCFQNEISGHNDDPAISQSGQLRAVQLDGKVTDPRAPPAVRRLKTQTEETGAQKQRSAVPVNVLKSLERLSCYVSQDSTGLLRA
jgi:hypothetical protein